MSKKIQIDTFFKDKLEHYTTQEATDLWDTLAARLDKEKEVPKARPIWYLLSMLLLISLGSFVWWTQSSHSPAPAGTLPSSTQKTEPAKIAESQEIYPNLHTGTSDNPPVGTRHTVSASGKTYQAPKSEKTQLEANRSSKKTTFVVKDKISSQSNALAATKNVFNLTPVSEERQESALSAATVQVDNDAEISFYDSSLQENPLKFSVVPLFSTPKMTLLEHDQPQNMATRCPSGFKLMPKPRFSVDALLGYNYALRVLQEHTAQNRNYINIRENTEHYHSAYSFGSRFSVSYRSGFVWRIGLMYNRLVEKIDLTDNPEFEHIPDRQILEQDNIYKFVDVPILIGFEAEEGKMAWGFNLGMYVNLMFQSPDNYILDADKEKILLNETTTSNETPVFRSEALGLSGYASLMAAYAIGENTYLLCEPYLHYRPQSLTATTYSLEQRYANFGVLAGLRFKF